MRRHVFVVVVLVCPNFDKISFVAASFAPLSFGFLFNILPQSDARCVILAAVCHLWLSSQTSDPCVEFVHCIGSDQLPSSPLIFVVSSPPTELNYTLIFLFESCCSAWPSVWGQILCRWSLLDWQVLLFVSWIIKPSWFALVGCARQHHSIATHNFVNYVNVYFVLRTSLWHPVFLGFNFNEGFSIDGFFDKYV